MFDIQNYTEKAMGKLQKWAMLGEVSHMQEEWVAEQVNWCNCELL